VAKSSLPLDRRRFLTLAAAAPLGLLGGRAPGVSAETHSRRGGFSAEVGILYDALSFRVEGTIEEAIDRARGRYHVTAIGGGQGVGTRIESAGQVRGGRWTCDRTSSWFNVRGRESRSEIAYDWAARSIHYRFRGETFFLRRLRVVDDTVPVPESLHVDDVMSALLNYADGHWKPERDGMHRTLVVRRRRRDAEGPDDVDADARAELVPFEMKVGWDPSTGKPAASFDMTRFSSWARSERPARIVFGGDRRPETITSSLILGTSLTVRLRDTT
jgi:hypothetical protein